MKKALFFLCVIGLSLAQDSDINSHLSKNSAMLKNYYLAVKKQSANAQYVRFRDFFLIDTKSYYALSPQEKKSLASSLLVMIAIYKRSKPLYSDFGGVSMDGILAEDIDDRRAKTFHYRFDGRYYTDLQNLKKSHILYAYCSLPGFNRCVLLGIGEEW
ncbi:hypothetical protein [Helicobacter mustelae]|uniref:Uncharacterized protein n=1 Tax=Helicobacter mustelae (strain ATCC 43772 / CCUG 25715 / CIP 103759 / LMG 18044 / NCTC 12198 / R85-136P) TaxID=679897 RepID=D3UHT4_HELM1|nr:hypothetical protein [Helicobacter mustelae]CBG40057.1 Putative hypothetical protein [Helicobacter mustelae 12198]SQH71571.1 Uncharacterised protein [Helicobacter mustelae]